MSKVKRCLIKVFLSILLLLVIISPIISSFYAGYYFSKRNHGDIVVKECVSFSETAKEIRNPNRGFYYIYGFSISDDVDVDYDEVVSEKLKRSEEHSLAMVQINLQEYANTAISSKGLQDIEALFCALKKQERQYLIRFLYDWHGDNLEVEPQDVKIIQQHMRQLEDILHEYKDIIFVHQGIFIGNWGEMNGTVHLDNLQLLAETLRSSLHEDTFMAVRMPAQWRKITETVSPTKAEWSDASIAHKLGLFNDGMMGNYGDYGTYGTSSREDMGNFSHWNREEELTFQEELCKYVPNGGEVIVDNEYNDFENALNNLRTMHITYLNYDYDKTVLDKWAETTIRDGSVYDGMNGLTYIDRHLGYRLLIHSVSMEYKYFPDVLTLCINLQNVGFAPIYKEVYSELKIVREQSGEIYSYVLDWDMSHLPGGNDSEYIEEIKEEIYMSGYAPGEYTLYFSMTDVDSGLSIIFANEQEFEEQGYKLGQIIIEEWKVPFFSK